jgi:hypothetical protein
MVMEAILYDYFLIIIYIFLESCFDGGPLINHVFYAPRIGLRLCAIQFVSPSFCRVSLFVISLWNSLSDRLKLFNLGQISDIL